MKKGDTRRYRSQWLAGLTAAALLGIVALQAYWLNTSYAEQQSRFRADVENAMVATLIKSQLSSAMAHKSHGTDDPFITEGLTDIISSVVRKLPAEATKGQPRVVSSVTIDMADSTSPQAQAMHKLIEGQMKKGASLSNIVLELNTDSLQQQPGRMYLDSMKSLLKTELQKRSIYTPSELALLDSNGHIYLSTCDTQAFRRIPIKSAASDPRFIYYRNGMRLQAAFPDANLYLLRRMAWVLSVTALLMLIGCISFGFLLRMFFRQKRLADIRNDFMNNMTHELKTPISSISVALELIQDSRHHISEETKQEYFGIAKSELQRLTMLVEKVLKMAAFEKSEIRISPELFLAASWLQDITASLRPVFETASARVTTAVQPELLMLYADKTHLTNVLQNLLENALKYNDKEVPVISIGIYEEAAMTVIKVTDNGRGIPPAYVTKVFDKFFRVPTGDRHDIKGYGLGLSYVKAVAELHGGTVTVSSTPGTGTTFVLLLPGQAAAQASGRTRPEN